MTTSNFSQSLAVQLDTAVAGTSMNALTSGSYALGAAIDNRPTSGSVVAYDLADLVLILSSAVTLGTGVVMLPVWVLEAVDGGTTNYASPNSAAAASMSLQRGVFVGVAGASTSVIVVPNILIGPYSFKVLIQNSLGVSLPATNTSTCQIQRKTLQNW